MKKYLLLCITLFAATSLSAQVTAPTMGYQDDLATLTAGGLFGNLNLDLLLGPIGDTIDDDSKSTFGAKVGYMFYLYDENGVALFLGPQVGYFGTENHTLETSESGLLYGGEVGVYFSPLLISVGYGMNDVSELEYFSFKVGFNFMDLW